jgi:hypothetical protein
MASTSGMEPTARLLLAPGNSAVIRRMHAISRHRPSLGRTATLHVNGFLRTLAGRVAVFAVSNLPMRSTLDQTAVVPCIFT